MIFLIASWLVLLFLCLKGALVLFGLVLPNRGPLVFGLELLQVVVKPDMLEHVRR